ncbi:MULTISPECIES: hypothetical protein [unclassified Nostoc]|uniref:hypothetical protein n=1 Tax=unclassified Nostoc TaxID=2593658 RepID=UPI001E0C09C2|nr:hypothetical protein [Nostoc sp. JL23]MBN3878018.1 hypothetical protein [Nostoc sp. JL23]
MSSAVGGLMNMLPDAIASRLETFFNFVVLKSRHPEIAIASPLTNIDFPQDIRR